MNAETLARKDGTCRLCLKPIVVGEDYIVCVDPVGWVHATCAHGYSRAMAENEAAR